MKYLYLILLLLLPSVLFADKIFFKIAIDDKRYSTFEFSEKKTINDNLHFILGKYQDTYFDLNNIKKEFYNIKEKHNIKFNGKNVNVYELFPVFKDRFTHMLWVNKNKIVRKEVYDLKGKLMYSYGHATDIPDMFFDMNRKLRKNNNKFKDLIYKGFEVKLLKRLKNNATHILFSDGINNFSVFETKPALQKGTIQKIILGNYVYSANLDNTTYTVVGTIPFEEMKNVIKFVSSRKLYTKGGK